VTQLPADKAIAPSQSAALSGIWLMVIAMLLLPVMDAAAKFMSGRIPVVEMVWARFFFHTLLLSPVILARHSLREFWPSRPVLQIARALTIVAATACFFNGVARMPLADMLAVFFIYPFIVTALSPWVLGDRVGPWRWTATIIGFIGALIIIRPGFTHLSDGVWYAIGAGLCYSFYALSTRKLAGSDPPLITLFFTGLIGLFVTAAVLPWMWINPTQLEWGLMALMGLVSVVGHACVIMASERAPAPLLAPLAYLEITSATLLGFVIFGDLPDAMTWVGMAIIVASGLVIAWRERVRGVAQPRTVVQAV
jgi:drug/metabolite transporter (DMT)-like permease